MIYVPIIRVYDKDTNEEHIVGTNRHDALFTDGEKISYHNYQNGCGTGGAYEFVGKKIPFDHTDMEVEMLSLKDFLELYAELAKEQNDREESLQEELSKIMEQFTRETEIKSKDGYMRHT